MRAIKQLIEVDRNNSVTLKALPFKPGSKVEVIIFPAEKEEDIFEVMDKTVKKKGIIPMSLKKVAKIVHEVRGVK